MVRGSSHLTRLQPYKVRPSPDETPYRWETGTQNHEAMAGVTAAIDYLAELGRMTNDEGRTTNDDHSQPRRAALLAGMHAIQQYERGLAERMIAGLLMIPGLTFYGISDPAHFANRTPTIAIRIDGHSPRAIASYLGERGIFAWDGNYYALGLTERLGVEPSGGMVRIGLMHYNTAEEIDRLLAALGELAGG